YRHQRAPLLPGWSSYGGFLPLSATVSVRRPYNPYHSAYTHIPPGWADPPGNGRRLRPRTRARGSPVSSYQTAGRAGPHRSRYSRSAFVEDVPAAALPAIHTVARFVQGL